MLCYKDRCFCYRECGNTNCSMNKANIDWKHVEEIGLPVAYQRKLTCANYIGVIDD